ncbi:ribonuclease Y-like [Morone saxatilis]|uniref:ribonuclease Y-like n=1 Tax=Morone saxatilis TaxID=34816 RepID=UPI0015E1FF03|nr:ribonuclease Y-like [Morone saxatilis]
MLLFSSAVRVGIKVVAVLVFILTAAFLFWKENQTKDTKLLHETETGNREGERLMAEEQKKEEEQKVCEKVVKTLTEQRKELQNQEDQLKQQMEDMEKNIKDIENKLQSVEKMAESEQCCELKEIILMAKTKLQERKHGDEELTLITQTIKNKTDVLLNTMTGQEGGSKEP